MPDPTGTEPQAEDQSPADEDAAERLPVEIDTAILRRYFTLNDADFDQIGQCRGASNKLGFSVQLCSLRWRGHFLADMRDVPAAVLQVLATQIGVLPMPLGEYPQDDKTRSAHLERIRQHLGFVRCDPMQRQRLLGYLTNMARDAPRTEVLRKSAYAWLLAERVVRPGRTTLRNLVARAREAGLQQLHDALTRDLTQAQCAQLDGLLATAETPVEVDGRPHVEVGVEPEAEAHSQLELQGRAPP